MRLATGTLYESQHVAHQRLNCWNDQVDIIMSEWQIINIMLTLQRNRKAVHDRRKIFHHPPFFWWFSQRIVKLLRIKVRCGTIRPPHTSWYTDTARPQWARARQLHNIRSDDVTRSSCQHRPTACVQCMCTQLPPLSVREQAINWRFSLYYWLCTLIGRLH